MWVACVVYFQPPEISQRYAIEVVIDHSTGLQRVIGLILYFHVFSDSSETSKCSRDICFEGMILRYLFCIPTVRPN